MEGCCVVAEDATCAGLIVPTVKSASMALQSLLCASTMLADGDVHSISKNSWGDIYLCAD